MILEINNKKLESNTREIVNRCRAAGIGVAGVIKGFSGIPECALAMERGGCDCLASSRLEQLENIAKHGVGLPLMMIRIPGPQEAARVVRASDISLNSEFETVVKLNDEAGKQGKLHKVLLMVELGDLREGIWDRQELLDTAVRVEKELENIELLGIGTNLGCYGSIAPTVEKMEELAEVSRLVEGAIGRELELVSGGSSTSFIRVMDKDMPGRINHLRIGENIINGRDLEDLWGCNTDFLFKDVFVLKAEVVEVKVKPTHPVGELTFDAFRNKPVYEDRGDRRRAIAAVGKVDYAWMEQLVPLDAGVSIIGASSDHTILDVEDAERDFKPGDMVSFGVCYGNTVFLTASPYAEFRFVRGV